MWVPRERVMGEDQGPSPLQPSPTLLRHMVGGTPSRPGVGLCADGLTNAALYSLQKLLPPLLPLTTIASLQVRQGHDYYLYFILFHFCLFWER